MRHTIIAAITAGLLFVAAAPAASQTFLVEQPAEAERTLTDGKRDARFNPQFRGAPPVAEMPVVQRRPKALVGLYASLAVVQVLDVTSTRAALRNGAIEVNPTLRGPVGQQLGIKAAMTLGTIAVAERLWKKNRLAAIGTAIGANVALAMITAHNLRNARR